MFLFEQKLQRPVADGAHGMVGHSRDEHGEELVGTGLERQALVVLGAREHLRHWVLALKNILHSIKFNYPLISTFVWGEWSGSSAPPISRTCGLGVSELGSTAPTTVL